MTDKVHDLNKGIKYVQKNIGQMVQLKVLKQLERKKEKKLFKTIIAPTTDPKGTNETTGTATGGVVTTANEEAPKKMNLRQRLEKNKEWQETRGKGIE